MYFNIADDRNKEYSDRNDEYLEQQIGKINFANCLCVYVCVRVCVQAEVYTTQDHIEEYNIHIMICGIICKTEDENIMIQRINTWDCLSLNFNYHYTFNWINQQ